MAPASFSRVRSRRPSMTRIHSSLRSWYWNESRLPVSRTSTLPTYLSVQAQMTSWPQGFATRRGRGVPSGARSATDELLAGRQQLSAPLGRGPLRVDPDEWLGAPSPDDQP